MRTPATITAIGPAHGCELIAHEMFVTGAPMTAAAKNPYLIYKIAFLHTVVQQSANIPCQYRKRRFMKGILFLLAILLVTGIQCSKNDYDAPACIEKKIASIRSKRKWNPPAQVNEYLYNGKKVYLFSSDCCDKYEEVFDENCNRLCAPYGGISGDGDGTCPDFRTNAQHIRLVWKDSR